MNPRLSSFAAVVVFLAAAAFSTAAATVTNKPTPGDRQLADYFRAETVKLETACLADVQSLDDWKARKETYRQQLFEMLGLSPLPLKTDLHTTITGRLEHEEFTVEKLHFQSMPQLYVGANLYLPKNLTKPAPAILYVSGHAVVETNGVRLGNKAGYQHHGEWFARHGYVCLTIDTIQLGELRGEHHGTHGKGMWWWNARGYTPAGVEAWNCIRALDYLQTRPEVDGARLGVTGRSGGGAYSWWIAALDERIKAACPVAGITDLHNHVIDGTVQGHCDCMFTVNTYRWDYAQVAALVAPRPLLICNTDKDSIFPLDGVQRLHEKVRNIYRLHGATANLGLLITEGPHKDTQDLQVPVFRWFNRFLKGEEPLIETAATKMFAPAELKVFKELPSDERTTTIHETFVPVAKATVPDNAGEWARQRDGWLAALREKSFRGWPENEPAVVPRSAFTMNSSGLRLRGYDFESQANVPLRLYTIEDSSAAKPKQLRIEVLDEAAWAAWFPALRGFDGQGGAPVAKILGAEASVVAALATNNLVTAQGDYAPAKLQRQLAGGNVALAFLAPRGVGLTAWNPTVREAPHIRRRFMLLGQTLDAMRVWDIRRGIQAVRQIKGFESAEVTLFGERAMGVNALYAALFEPDITALELTDVPASHRTGPDYLNVLRYLDAPQAVAMAGERVNVNLAGKDAALWQYGTAVARQLNWPANRISVHASR